MTDPIGDNAKAQLRSIVERIENVNDEIDLKRQDVKDLYTEAKGNGYDVPSLRQIVRMRAEDNNKRATREAILETYMVALGMI